MLPIQTEEPILNDDEILSLLASNKDNYTYAFAHLKKHKKEYLRCPAEKSTIPNLLAKYYFPAHKGDAQFFYNDFPPQEIWRLFVDVVIQQDPNENGFVGYETRAQGTIQDMYDAFMVIQDSTSEPLSTDYIKTIHRVAAAHCKPFVRHSMETTYISINPGEFKTSRYGNVTLCKEWVTPFGYVQMLEYFKKATRNNEGKIYIDLPFPEQGYQHSVSEIIKKYEENILTDDPLKQLKALIVFVQALDRVHPFKDGNTRLAATLILNKELIRLGFSPTVLKDPNCNQGFSRKEMLFQVLEGMENFNLLKTSGCLPNCKTTEDILSENVPYPIIRHR